MIIGLSLSQHSTVSCFIKSSQLALANLWYRCQLSSSPCLQKKDTVVSEPDDDVSSLQRPSNGEL